MSKRGRPKKNRSPDEFIEKPEHIVEQEVLAPFSRAKNRLAKVDQSSPLAFFIPEELAEAYQRSNWDVQRETAILIEIADDDSDRRCQLAALQVLQKRRYEALVASGEFQELQVTRKKLADDGTVTTEDLKIMQMGTPVVPRVVEADIIEEGDNGSDEDPQDAEEGVPEAGGGSGDTCGVEGEDNGSGGAGTESTEAEGAVEAPVAGGRGESVQQRRRVRGRDEPAETDLTHRPPADYDGEFTDIE